MVFKLSGSLVYPPRPDYLRGLRAVVERLVGDGYSVAIVVGGGRVARELIAAAREVGVGQWGQDLLGIGASRLNALLLAHVLRPLSLPRVPVSLEDAVEYVMSGRVPVMGGLQPGQSTNAVALLLAEALGASRVVNALRGVAGVYDRDPGQPGARLLPRLSLDELERIVEGYPQEAGRYSLIDHLAIQVARRSRIPIIFVDGERLDQLEAAARGEPVGSQVLP